MEVDDPFVGVAEVAVAVVVGRDDQTGRSVCQTGDPRPRWVVPGGSRVPDHQGHGRPGVLLHGIDLFLEVMGGELAGKARDYRRQ